MKKKIAALVMALAVAVSPMTVAAEWKQDSYQNWQWVENGTPATGWKFIGQNWYYFGNNGKMVTGWQKIDGKWYYFNRGGAMQTGWVKLDGKWYYMNGSGEMVTGWKKVAGYWYYMDSQGVMQTGWLSYGNDKYYLAPKGDMQVGWVEVGEDRYFMNHDGVIQVGMIEVDGEVYYFGADGKMVTGKVKIGGKQYEFAKTGESVGKLTPQPGKAFDTSGFSTTITVEGGTSSSSGSTIVYVPVDNGNSGSTGENPGGTTDIPDDLTDQQERDRLDDYLEQQVALYGTDYYRDFTVSFDRSSHIVDITIQNPDKRIINMIGLGLQRMIGDYDDGKITRFSINGCAYHNLYVVQRRRRVYTSLASYSSEFQKTASDVDILDTLGALDGKTVKMTLRNEDMTYRSYTFRFTVNGDAEYADDVAYYMSTELRSDNGVYLSNYKAKCEQRGNDIFVSLNDYDSLDSVQLRNFVYHNVYYNSLWWNTKVAIESGKVFADSYSLYDTNCGDVEYAVKQTEGDTDTYIFYDRDGQEVTRYQIQNVESGILLLGMNLKDFNRTDKTQDTSQQIGWIDCTVDSAVNPDPTPDPGPIPPATEEECANLDNYLSAQLASLTNYRGISASIDTSSRVITLAIKDPDQRIVNLFGFSKTGVIPGSDGSLASALTQLIGNYEDGKITQFSVNGCEYHNLYVTSGGIRSYTNMMNYSSEYQKTLGAGPLDCLSELIGKSFSLTLRSEEVTYPAYTVQFTSSDAQTENDVSYKFQVTYDGEYNDNNTVTAYDTTEGVYVKFPENYSKICSYELDNFVYDGIYFHQLRLSIGTGQMHTAGGYLTEQDLYDLTQLDKNMRAFSWASATEFTPGSGIITYLFYDENNKLVTKLKAKEIAPNAVLFMGLKLSDFAAPLTVDKTEQVIGSFGLSTNSGTTDPDPTPGETKVEYTLDENASTDYTLDENGLTFGMPEGKEARFISTNLTFNEGVSVGDVKVTKVQFGDFVDGTSQPQDRYLYTDHGSFDYAAYTEENGIRTYTFKNDTVEVPIRVRVSEDGTLTFPDFTAEKLQGQNVQMTATSRGRVIVTDRNPPYEGESNATWSFNEEGKLVLQALDGEHFADKLTLSFDTAYTLENASISTLEIYGIYADNCVQVAVETSAGYSADVYSYILNDDVMTFRVTIPSLSQSFAFSVKRSEDRKTVVLEDITRDSLLSNTISVWIPTIPDSTAYVYSESELEKACADPQVNKIYIADNFSVSKTLTIENRTIEMVGSEVSSVGSSEAKIVLIHSGTKENPTKLSKIGLSVIAKNSVIVGKDMRQSIELEGSTLDVYSFYGYSQFEVKMDLDKNVENTSTVTFYVKPNVKRVISGNENSQVVVASGIDASYTKTFDEGNGYWVWTLDQ